jgi:hypothetical protein
MWFQVWFFTKYKCMQPTLLLLWRQVFNACVATQMHLKIKANTFMNKPLKMNKIHYYLLEVIWLLYMQNRTIRICQNEHVFTIPMLKPILNHPHWNILEYHYITHSHAYTICISFHMCPPWSAITHGSHLILRDIRHH